MFRSETSQEYRAFRNRLTLNGDENNYLIKYNNSSLQWFILPPSKDDMLDTNDDLPSFTKVWVDDLGFRTKQVYKVVTLRIKFLESLLPTFSRPTKMENTSKYSQVKNQRTLTELNKSQLKGFCNDGKMVKRIEQSFKKSFESKTQPNYEILRNVSVLHFLKKTKK